ncbi:CopG family transcriptional regulator [Halorarum halophilum]|uniref:CopG family transcriptional regulator n=1 Tax=Halorarum halophilum TaxID=2743090 RepID=A0A7D5K1G7_9EURY|nr:CopG family transcriptional regulator [Halobaculum halophilum]QLG27881.1 CopG family transcriptional regulator [Halobaculum halophilum]
MAGEQVDALPDGLREWVHARAEETDRSPADVLARATAAYRLLNDYEGDLDGLGGFPENADRVDGNTLLGLSETVAELDERVATVEDDLDEKIDDVRSRVVQVKRETDGKADADHDHPDLRRTAETAEVLADDVEDLRADLDDLESTFEEGFANYEEVLEYLTDATEELEGKANTLASVAAEVRTRLGNLEAREARTRAAAELKDEANRLGVETATCGACSSKVSLGLLSAPECPNCGGTFEAVEGSRGFFGSATLTVGTRPALEGETAEELGPEDIFDD